MYYKIIEHDDEIDIICMIPNQDDECVAIIYTNYQRPLAQEMVKARKRAKDFIEILKAENSLSF